MKEALTKLLKVKSLLTLMLAVVFCVQALRGIIDGEALRSAFEIVIAFYFGVQSTKEASEDKKPEAGDGHEDRD